MIPVVLVDLTELMFYIKCNLQCACLTTLSRGVIVQQFIQIFNYFFLHLIIFVIFVVY